MAQSKIDGIIEAIHLSKDGEVEWVRAYLRRGPTWSDRLLLDRETLIKHLRGGKQFFLGQRTPRLASTFVTSRPIQLVIASHRELLVTGGQEGDKDCLEDAPLV